VLTDPENEVPSCARVRLGDHIPGIPSRRFTIGFDYWVKRTDYKVTSNVEI